MSIILQIYFVGNFIIIFVYLNSFLGGDKIGLNEINEDDFLIKVNQNRTIINKPTASTSEPGTQDPVEFMKTMEKDANDRAADRKSRESIAQGLRKYVAYDNNSSFIINSSVAGEEMKLIVMKNMRELLISTLRQLIRSRIVQYCTIIGLSATYSKYCFK